MVSEFSSFAITGYINTKAPPEVTGNITGLLYWYEGLADWVSLTDTPPTVPLGTAFHLAAWWLNQSSEPISGHVGLTITKPDGTKVTPADVLNQNNWAAPGNSWIVQFEPIVLDQTGEYQAKVTLSTMGQTLDEKTYPIAYTAGVVGMITLYMTGVSTEEWQVGWYYADEDIFRYHREDYRGVPDTSWRAPEDPCTPPPEYPIDLNNLIVKINTFSNVHVCPKTGYKGYCGWGDFGPFVVKDGGVYTLNVATGELLEVEAAPSGEILEITSWDEENEIWRPITDPIPEYEEITHRFRVNNTGSAAAFKIGYCYWDSFQQRWIWIYSPSFDIEPGEGNIDWRVYTGGAGTFSVTFHLFSDDIQVDSMTVRVTVR